MWNNAPQFRLSTLQAIFIHVDLLFEQALSLQPFRATYSFKCFFLSSAAYFRQNLLIDHCKIVLQKVQTLQCSCLQWNHKLHPQLDTRLE